MKTIAVIGCSNSTGEETRDWELDPEYYTKTDITHEEWYKSKRSQLIPKFFAKRPELLLEEDPSRNFSKEEWQEHLNGVSEGKNLFIHDVSWHEYCDKYSWPSLLDNMSEDYKVYNFSTRGAGLAYFELAYNIPRVPREYDNKGRHILNGLYKPTKKYDIKNRARRQFYSPDYDSIGEGWDFKEIVDTADILIWQITNEPRYSLTFNIDNSLTKYDMDLTGYLSYASSQDSLQQWLTNYLEGDVLKTMSEFYKYYYDNTTNFSRSLTWMDMLMQLREDRGLQNMMFPIHRTFTSRLGITARHTEHTKSYGMDLYEYPDSGSCPGILLDGIDAKPSEILFTAKPSPDQYCAKYTHPSEKGHRAIADFIYKKLQEDYK